MSWNKLTDQTPLAGQYEHGSSGTVQRGSHRRLAPSLDEIEAVLGVPREQTAIEIEAEGLQQKEPSMDLEEPLDILSESLKADGISAHALQQYLTELAAKKNDDPKFIIQTALREEMLPKFKAAYQKFLGRIVQAEQLPLPDAAVPA